MPASSSVRAPAGLVMLVMAPKGSSRSRGGKAQGPTGTAYCAACGLEWPCQSALRLERARDELQPSRNAHRPNMKIAKTQPLDRMCASSVGSSHHQGTLQRGKRVMGSMQRRLRTPRVARIIAAVAATLAVVSSGLGVPASAADSRDPDTSHQVILRNQDHLIRVTDEIDRVTDRYGTGTAAPIDGAESRFTAVVIDPVENLIDLYWSGDIPPTVQEILSRYPEVHVRTHRTRYSLNELTAAQLRVVAAAEAGALATSGIDVRVVAAASTWDGLEVVVASRADARAVGTGDQESARTLSEVSGVQVAINASQSAVPVSAASRQADVSPWYGGAAIHLSGTVCTSGFGVTKDSTKEKYIITAQHCLPAGSSGTVKTPTGATLGSWSSSPARNAPSLDATLVRPASQSVSNRIYTGAYNSSTSGALAGAATTVLGSYVCTSGAKSGEHCLLKVTGKNVYALSPMGVTFGTHAVASTQVAGVAAAAQGDSGGPVYRSMSGEKYGVGIINSISGLYSCSGSWLKGGTGNCGSSVIFASLPTILKHFSVRLG